MELRVGGKFPYIHRVKGISQPVLSVENDGTGFFYSITGSGTAQDTRTVQGQLQAYQRCPAVSGIIHKKVAAHLNGELWICNEDEKEAPNSAAFYTIRRLMQRPNVMQSWDEFYAQAQLFMQIFGEVFIMAIVPVGFNINNCKALWVLPNWDMSIKATGKMFYQFDRNEIIEGYYLRQEKIPSEFVLHIKDAGYNYDNPLNGMSRLSQLQDPVSNIIAAYESRNVLITRRGAIGILSNESKDTVGALPLKPEEKTELQNDFRRYGLMRDKWQVIISNAALKWQSMTYSTRDLMLFEEIEADTRQIADNYGYPSYLLGFTGGTTFNNVNEAKKSLYQDTIIPEADAFFDAFSAFFGLKEKGYEVECYFDELDIFQESENEKAQAMLAINQANQIAYQNGIITLEEWRQMLDFDPKLPKGTTYGTSEQ